MCRLQLIKTWRVIIGPWFTRSCENSYRDFFYEELKLASFKEEQLPYRSCAAGHVHQNSSAHVARRRHLEAAPFLAHGSPQPSIRAALRWTKLKSYFLSVVAENECFFQTFEGKKISKDLKNLIINHNGLAIMQIPWSLNSKYCKTEIKYLARLKMVWLTNLS